MRASTEGKPIPTELRRDEQALRREIALEDDNTAVPRTHIDDEYAHAGERDPKILVTTSRDPSSRLTQFAKELKLVFPNAQRINRGSQVRRGLKWPSTGLVCRAALQHAFHEAKQRGQARWACVFGAAATTQRPHWLAMDAEGA